MITTTEKELRKKRLNNALALNSLDAAEPCSEDMAIFEKYVEGNISYQELKIKLLNKYRNEV